MRSHDPGARAVQGGLFLVAVAMVVTLDQVSKAAVRSTLALGERVDVALLLELRHARNTGIAFGLFSGAGQLVVLASVLVAGLLLVMLLTVPARDRYASLAIGLIAGGALGNIVDRVRLGYVTDFLQLPHWPTFNVADSAIVLGVTLIVLQQVHAAWTETRSARSAPAQPKDDREDPR